MLRRPGFPDSRPMKVARLSDRPPLLAGEGPWYTFMFWLSRPQGHSAARMINSTKNLKDPIRNRTRDLPAFTAYPISNGNVARRL